MNKKQYFSIYQQNIKLLELQINQVKKTTQSLIGKKTYLEKKNISKEQKKAMEQEILASTRLYTFLICAWLEARLLKILYEDSSAAFTDNEIQSIRNVKTIGLSWKTVFNIAVCKKIGIPYNSQSDLSSLLPVGTVISKNYNQVQTYFDKIDAAATARNRLAHDQWDYQFNANNTALNVPTIINDYDNIQKLQIIMQIFNHIAEIINIFVVYKDQNNPNFDKQTDSLFLKIKEKEERIKSLSFEKYSINLCKTYENSIQFSSKSMSHVSNTNNINKLVNQNVSLKRYPKNLHQYLCNLLNIFFHNKNIDSHKY